MAKIKYFNARELGLFFKRVKENGNVRNQAMFAICFHHGLRVGELINLRLDDFSEGFSKISVRREKNGIDYDYPVNPDDTKLLKKWLKLRKKHKYADRNPFLFITAHNTTDHIKKITAQKLFEKTAKEAGLSKTNIHVLRHSAAIDLIMQNKDVGFIRFWLGHSSITSTMVYLQLANPEWEKISAKAVLNFSV